MKVRGRCYCRYISFEADIQPDKVRVCHCTDCQTLSGSAFRTNVPVVHGMFVLKKRASSWIPAFLCGSTTLAKLRPWPGEMTALSGA
jgi:hypothetical protein